MTWQIVFLMLAALVGPELYVFADWAAQFFESTSTAANRYAIDRGLISVMLSYGYISVVLLPYFISSGAPGSPGLLASCSTITILLHNT
tara:strand:+ start:432 stop:698 length:267 start_codon:yes stop_codon:yes gene_type:complete